jgi:hypothetical protein
MSQENVLDDFAVTVQFSIKEINSLLNILNTPTQVPATTLVAFINLIQQQAAPQAQKAADSLVAVAKAKDEPKTTS